MVAVLNENNYTMQQGGISVAHAAHRKGGEGAQEQGRRSRMQVAGRDYGHMDFCQVRGETKESGEGWEM